MPSFEGKTVLITGASSGIGRGLAIEFATLGANLVLGGRDLGQLAETKNQCIKHDTAPALQIIWVAGDIADDSVQRDLVQSAINKFGQLDVLVNNAGMAVTTLASDMKMETFDKIYNVNLRAAVNLSLLAMPHLIKSKGSIVNVSSAAARNPIVGNLAYGISKASMDMLTKSMAFEMAPHGVRVNSVNPAVVKTNISRDRGLTEEQTEARYKMLGPFHPLGRIGEIKEVVDSIVFLASTDASFVTGQLLGVDGGAATAGVKNLTPPKPAPPSMPKHCPVINELCGDAKNTIVVATSFTSPHRPSG